MVMYLNLYLLYDLCISHRFDILLYQHSKSPSVITYEILVNKCYKVIINNRNEFSL